MAMSTHNLTTANADPPERMLTSAATDTTARELPPNRDALDAPDAPVPAPDPAPPLASARAVTVRPGDSRMASTSPPARFCTVEVTETSAEAVDARRARREAPAAVTSVQPRVTTTSWSWREGDRAWAVANKLAWKAVALKEECTVAQSVFTRATKTSWYVNGAGEDECEGEGGGGRRGEVGPGNSGTWLADVAWRQVNTKESESAGFPLHSNSPKTHQHRWQTRSWWHWG
jgi:hypothetical protein